MEKTISIRNTEITFSVRPHHVFPLSIGHPQTDRGLLLWLGRVGQIWDLGGQREFVSMLPLVSNDAVAILFMFDLTRKSTLNSIKEWYRQARGFNNVRLPPPLSFSHSQRRAVDDCLVAVVTQTAIPVLIGTKYDQFATFARDEQEEITKQVSARPLSQRPRSMRVTQQSFFWTTGKTLLESDARPAHILLDTALD